MCFESEPAPSRARSLDGPCSGRALVPSVASEESLIVGTRSSKRDVAASSLPSIVSASFEGSAEGIVSGVQMGLTGCNGNMSILEVGRWGKGKGSCMHTA